jgi:hypothetical protein
MAVNEDMNLAFHDALNSEQPLTRVRELARRELQHGVSRSEVLGQLESLRLELRGGEKPEDEDVVLDVMDFVTGWSSPHMKL